MRHLILAAATAAALATACGPAGAQTAPAPAPYTPPAAAPATPPPAPVQAAPLADDDMTRAVTSLATGIEDVQVVGPWTEGEKNGVWRTVMMTVPNAQDKYRFFIQQLEKTADSLAITATTEIKEISTVNGAVVGYRADEPTEGDTSSLTLFFDVVPSDGEIAETYELHFSKDGPYTFGPASN